MSDYTILKEAMQEMSAAELKVLAQKMLDYRTGFKEIKRPAISKFFGQLAALLMMEKLDRKKTAKEHSAALLNLETTWSDTGQGESITLEDLAELAPDTFEKISLAYDALSDEIKKVVAADAGK